MLEGIFFWQCLRPGLFATSPASLPAPHFGLFASIPIAFAYAAATPIVMPRIPPTLCQASSLEEDDAIYSDY